MQKVFQIDTKKHQVWNALKVSTKNTSILC